MTMKYTQFHNYSCFLPGLLSVQYEMFPKFVTSLKPAFLMTFYRENICKSGFNHRTRRNTLRGSL